MSKSQGGNEFPHEIGKNLPADYVLVTEENRSEYLVHGRLCYIVKQWAGKYVLMNCFDIRPRLIKGNRTVYNDPLRREGYSVRIMEDEPLEEYQEKFRIVVKSGIAEKQLYIKKTDQLIQYKNEK